MGANAFGQDNEVERNRPEILLNAQVVCLKLLVQPEDILIVFSARKSQGHEDPVFVLGIDDAQAVQLLDMELVASLAIEERGVTGSKQVLNDNAIEDLGSVFQDLTDAFRDNHEAAVFIAAKLQQEHVRAILNVHRPIVSQNSLSDKVSYGFPRGNIPQLD